MIYTKEIYESSILGIYWCGTKDSRDWGAYHWECGCFWFCLGWIKINISYRKHNPSSEIYIDSED
jgi:hypothetical protein